MVSLGWFSIFFENPLPLWKEFHTWLGVLNFQFIVGDLFLWYRTWLNQKWIHMLQLSKKITWYRYTCTDLMTMLYFVWSTIRFRSQWIKFAYSVNYPQAVSHPVLHSQNHSLTETQPVTSRGKKSIAKKTCSLLFPTSFWMDLMAGVSRGKSKQQQPVHGCCDWYHLCHRWFESASVFQVVYLQLTSPFLSHPSTEQIGKWKQWDFCWIRSLESIGCIYVEWRGVIRVFQNLMRSQTYWKKVWTLILYADNVWRPFITTPLVLLVTIVDTFCLTSI